MPSISGRRLRNSIAQSAGCAEGCTPSSSRFARTTRERFFISSRCGSRRRKRFVYMKKTRKTAKPITAEAIARLADQGEDVSRFFKRQIRMVHPVQRVNVDLTAAMLEELDQA